MPRHHTVPEMYLKGFFDPARVAVRQNVLWLYEENRKIRPRGADAVAAVRDSTSIPRTSRRRSTSQKAYAKFRRARGRAREAAGGIPGSPRKKRACFDASGSKVQGEWYRETVNAAGVDKFRHTCQRILDEGRVHEYAGTSEAERSGRVKFARRCREVHPRHGGRDDRAHPGEQRFRACRCFGGRADVDAEDRRGPLDALRGPGVRALDHDRQPRRALRAIPGPAKPGVYGPSLQFLFPISPRFLLFGEPMTPGPDDRGRVPAHTVRMFTDDLLKIAHRQVYASIFSKELQSRVNRVFKRRGH